MQKFDELIKHFNCCKLYNFFLIYTKSIFLFVFCFGFLIPLEIFYFIWKRHHCRWRTAKFDLCSAFLAIKQWGLISLTHLLWHGASVYNSHLWGPVTLTPIAERLEVDLSLPVFTISVAAGIRTPNPRLRDERSNPYRHRHG